MIKKCDFKGCEKAGVCRAPKSRDLKEYWHFCKEHAAEYNKNWNYYTDMTPEEIEEDWETQVFGAPTRDNKKQAQEYADFINDFLTGRSKFDAMASKKTVPTGIVASLKIFGLSVNASWREIGAAYRKLAKEYHPDTARDKIDASAKFAKLNEAYKTLQNYYKK